MSCCISENSWLLPDQGDVRCQKFSLIDACLIGFTISTVQEPHSFSMSLTGYASSCAWTNKIAGIGWCWVMFAAWATKPKRFLAAFTSTIPPPTKEIVLPGCRIIILHCAFIGVHSRYQVFGYANTTVVRQRTSTKVSGSKTTSRKANQSLLGRWCWTRLQCLDDTGALARRIGSSSCRT